MCRSVVIVANKQDSNKANDENPGPSRESSTWHVSEDSSGSSNNEFSEPDQDPSDEWLPTGSTMRAAKPNPQTQLQEDMREVRANFPLLSSFSPCHMNAI